MSDLQSIIHQGTIADTHRFATKPQYCVLRRCPGLVADGRFFCFIHRKCTRPDCTGDASWGEETCVKHRCLCHGQPCCHNLQLPDSRVCLQHQCSVPDCTKPKLSAQDPEICKATRLVQQHSLQALFCIDHTCSKDQCLDKRLMIYRGDRIVMESYCPVHHYKGFVIDRKNIDQQPQWLYEILGQHSEEKAQLGWESIIDNELEWETNQRPKKFKEEDWWWIEIKDQEVEDCCSPSG